jgi:nucleoside-diphosphate-sugar epimerase
MRVLVTGASGFVGSAVLKHLADQGHEVRGAYRHGLPPSPPGTDGILVGDLGDAQDWRAALAGVSAVVHTAARVHILNDRSLDPLAEFRRVNVEGTANLARQAAAAGVRRFVFLSSIKVNGEYTVAGQSFTADDVTAPQDAYGISKHEAEQSLRQIAEETGMEVVIIRSPLVYGPGVKANFAAMMRWLARGLPLPLFAVTQNRRSLVALDNLVDLIVTCLDHPAAAHQTFLVSDGEDLSTADLLRRMGGAMGRAARLFYVPTACLKLAADLVNKPGIYQRLCGSLQLDITKTRQVLGWVPPVSVNEGLRRAAEGLYR